MTETRDETAKRLADEHAEGYALVEGIIERKKAAGFCESYKNFKEMSGR